MKKLTDEQQIFFCGQITLKKLARVAEKRPLTAEEIAKKDEVENMLFQSVVCFGISLANKRIRKYKISQDAYHDIQQSLAVIFLEKLPFYDPTKTTPTTYFLRYFNQAISEYLLADSQHLTQYDAHNISLVRGAKQWFEAHGIKWDEQMLSTRTGLSPKVVKNTLALEANSGYANIDDELFLQSKEPTPEQAYIEREHQQEMIQALHSTLTTDEYEFLMYKLSIEEGADGSLVETGREHNFQQVSEYYDIQAKNAKKYFSSITSKLYSNPTLQSYRSKKGYGDAHAPIHRAPAPLEDDFMLDALSGPEIHFGPDASDPI